MYLLAAVDNTRKKVKHACIGKSVEVASVLLSTVLAIFLGLFIPWDIDRKNVQRENNANCFSSLLTTRDSANQLQQLYTIDQAARGNIIAGWQDLDLSVSNSDFMCSADVLDNYGIRSTLTGLSGEFDAQMLAASNRGEDRSYIEDIVSWSDTTMEYLVNR